MKLNNTQPVSLLHIWLGHNVTLLITSVGKAHAGETCKRSYHRIGSSLDVCFEQMLKTDEFII